MKEFSYKITDDVGIHARPAGLLVKASTGFGSEIKLHSGEKAADAKKIFSVMGLGVKQGDEVRITIEGDDEEKAAEELKKFFEENL